MNSINVPKLLQRMHYEIANVNSRIVSLYWSYRFNLAHLWMHSSGRIVGRKYIQIDQYFRAGRMLWLEAVSQYSGINFSPSLRIGRHFSCGDVVHIACAYKIEIGQNVLIGSRVHITDHNHGSYGDNDPSPPNVAPLLRTLSGSPVTIGSNVFIGDGVIILPGSHIGDGVVVGANSLVSTDLPSNTICVGIPAVPVKRYCEKNKRWISINSSTEIN